MTDEELDRLAEKLADLKLSPQKTKEKPRKKGLFSKVVVTLCILIVIAYTSICLLMQWAYGMHVITGDLVRDEGVVWEAKKDMKPCIWRPAEGNEWTKREDLA